MEHPILLITMFKEDQIQMTTEIEQAYQPINTRFLLHARPLTSSKIILNKVNKIRSKSQTNPIIVSRQNPKMVSNKMVVRIKVL